MAERVDEFIVEPPVEAILEAAERVDESIVEPPVEAILEATERADEFIVDPPVEAVHEAAERSRRTRDRIQAALRHSIVYRPRLYWRPPKESKLYVI